MNTHNKNTTTDLKPTRSKVDKAMETFEATVDVVKEGNLTWQRLIEIIDAGYEMKTLLAAMKHDLPLEGEEEEEDPPYKVFRLYSLREIDDMIDELIKEAKE